MKKNKKIKIVYKEDDGRTIYDMNNTLKPVKNSSKEENNIILTKAERKAMRKGLFLSMFPMFICILVAFILVYFLMKLWLLTSS